MEGRIEGPRPRREHHGHGDRLHASDRDVDEELVYLAHVERLEVVGDHIDVPVVEEGGSRLYDVPSLSRERA